MLSSVFRIKNRELINLLFAKTSLDSNRASKASGIAIQIIKDGLVAKFEKGQVDELIGLISNDDCPTTFARELEAKTADQLKATMNLAGDLASQVAVIAVSFLISSLGRFMQERGKDNRDGFLELMAEERKLSAKNKFLGRFRRK